jgi:hypothetical protein
MEKEVMKFWSAWKFINDTLCESEKELDEQVNKI